MAQELIGQVSLCGDVWMENAAMVLELVANGCRTV